MVQASVALNLDSPISLEKQLYFWRYVLPSGADTSAWSGWLYIKES